MPQQRKRPLLLSSEALIKSAQLTGIRPERPGMNLAINLGSTLFNTEE